MHHSRLPGRYLTLGAAHAMGRLDRAGRYHPHHRIQYSHLCHAENIGQPQGSQEAHCGERRHERRKLL